MADQESSIIDGNTLKRISVVFCSINAFVAIYLSMVVLAPAYFGSYWSNPGSQIVYQSLEAKENAILEEQSKLGRQFSFQNLPDIAILIKKSEAARRDVNPSELIKRVNEIKEEAMAKDRMISEEEMNKLKEEELVQKELKYTSNKSFDKEKATIRRRDLSMKELKVKAFAEAVRLAIYSQDGLPDNIPGPAVKKECNAKTNADYAGVAVVWGAHFKVKSASECCQACIDHAKKTVNSSIRCNIWVYCPNPLGCYSPDNFDHKHQECWLKRAAYVRVNYEGFYGDDFLQSHPNAPQKVQWVSGNLY